LDPYATKNGSHLDHAVALLVDLKEAAPRLHVHGFSPQELLFLSQQDNLPCGRWFNPCGRRDWARCRARPRRCSAQGSGN
jgi:hypothetical protein